MAGHWKFDETSGPSAADSSGNGNSGTLSNGPVWTTGKMAGGLDFDGVDDVVDCGSGSSLDNLSAITVAAWIKADSMGEGGFGRIVSKAVDPTFTSGWHFMLSHTNQLTFSVDHATAEVKRRAGDNAISMGVWQHVAVTWTGSTTGTDIKMYVNGVEVSGYDLTNNGSGTRVDDASSNLYLGNNSGGTRTFDGVMDDVRVYSGVLSPGEIEALYEAGIVPAAPSGLLATAVSSSQINLAWADNSDNETGFKVERKTGAGGTYGQIDTTGANATGYVNTALLASTTYYYKVRATNSAGNSAFSNETSATTQSGVGELLFLSDFETGAIQAETDAHDGWLIQAMDPMTHPYSLNVVTAADPDFPDSPIPRLGTYSARFEVREFDNPLQGDFNPRVQILQREHMVEQGIVHYLGFSIYIPNNFTTSHQHLVQFFSDQNVQPTGSYGPFWKIVTHNDEWSIRAEWQSDDDADPIRSGQTNITTGGHSGQNPKPLIKGQWMDFLVLIKFDNVDGTNGNGRSKVWMNGVLYADYTGPLGPPNGKGPMRFILDVYGPVASGSANIAWHDEVRISNENIGTLDSVDVRNYSATVTASADDGNVPANTLDGDLGTRWSALGDGQWIKFDLGSPRMVTSVPIAFYLGDQRVAYFDIATSTDNINWTTVLTSGQSSGTSTALETFNVTSSTARYVRITGHGNSANLWNSYTEVDVP